MRLKYQIFLTLLASSALLIAIMYLLSSWIFSRGFLQYVNQHEQERLNLIAEELVYRYELTTDWSFLRRDTFNRLDSLRDGGEILAFDRPGLPPKSEDRGPRNENDRQGPRNRSARPTRLVLADTNKQAIFGQIGDESIEWVTLESNNKKIGYLGYREISRVDRHFDQVFESKQKKTFVWTALAMVLLSGLISIPAA